MSEQKRLLILQAERMKKVLAAAKRLKPKEETTEKSTEETEGVE